MRTDIDPSSAEHRVAGIDDLKPCAAKKMAAGLLDDLDLAANGKALRPEWLDAWGDAPTTRH